MGAAGTARLGCDAIPPAVTAADFPLGTRVASFMPPSQIHPLPAAARGGRTCVQHVPFCPTACRVCPWRSSREDSRAADSARETLDLSASTTQLPEPRSPQYGYVQAGCPARRKTQAFGHQPAGRLTRVS